MAGEGLINSHLIKHHLGSDLRRSNSSPISAACSEVIVKVAFPSLDCTKILRINPIRVNYEPFTKMLAIARVDEEERREFRLFTTDGKVINPGDSLLECDFKEKDTFIFKRGNYDTRNADTGVRRMSTALDNTRKYSLSSSVGDMRNMYPVGSNTGTTLGTGSDYWATVSTFIGSFLKRRPPVSELPRHVLEMMIAPLIPRSHVIVTCISYLRTKEAETLEGIFRLSGLATEVHVVSESFKQETFDLDWVRNPHTVATALKHYCRISSIIPSEICTPWAQVMRDSRDEGEVLQSIVKGAVLDNQDTNKMAAHSLSVVWGPNLIHFHIPAVDAFSEANIQATIMYIILTHLDSLRLLD